MQTRKNVICIWLSILILMPVFLLGQGYVQQVGGTGKVNWTSQVIKCTGIGAPNPDQSMAAQRAGALRAAKLDALRNLLETVKGININSQTTVEDAMVTSDVIQSNVKGAVRGYQVVDTRYMSSGDVEVDVEVPITGIIMDNLLQQQFGGGTLLTGEQLLCPTCGQPWPAGKQVPPGVDLIHVGGDYQADYGAGGVYTGLIIDARGLNVRPAMAPKVLDPKGEEVYGSRYVEREYAVDIGMVGYEKNVDRAAHNDRVADNPLIVKGIEATGQNKTDIIISDADAVKIHNAASNMNFLEHCKVMFILD